LSSVAELLEAVLMPRLLTGSVGVPDWHWLPPCRTSQSFGLSLSCLDLGATQRIGCPLDLGVPGVKLAGVVHPSISFPWPS
jgi:hypothetical protein